MHALSVSYDKLYHAPIHAINYYIFTLLIS